MTGHPEDVCTCGDYRRQHADGNGACDFNEVNGPFGHFGAPKCKAFDLDEAATKREREARIPQSTNAAGVASYPQAPPAVTVKTRKGQL